jgi:hypothetical protein
MSYLSSRCPTRYSQHHGPWKIARGLGSIEEGKTHDFHKYLEVFIVGALFFKSSWMYGMFSPFECMEFSHCICILGQLFYR